MVSVVVCTYNRDKYIGKCLDHLHNQSASRDDYEVIIVDNNSTDDTEKICHEKITEYSNTHFKYHKELNQGHSYSRNRGIRESKGEIISFIDDDAFVDKDFVKNIILFFEHNASVVSYGGKIEPVYENKKPKWMSQYLLPLVAALDMGDKELKFKGRKFPIGANMGFRKEVFSEFGYFDVKLGRIGTALAGGDEKEIFLRLKTSNQSIFYVPSIRVSHIIPEKRLSKKYIKGLARGVGESESIRLSDKGFKEKFDKVMEESFKVGATFVLFLFYFLTLQFSKGIMLLRFRFWVISRLKIL
ncbi:MAG TPA: glycosyltransferase family 2 protein [Cytophagales bacterium]|jgi:glycosyltransferase involved in cell wall biosynthesis|nr:glycosyltransferase family 2 protein [Cytophagales bacterium]